MIHSPDLPPYLQDLQTGKAFAKNEFMPRKPFIPTLDPYHVSTRCINKEWFSAPLPEVWDVMCKNLTKIHMLYGVELHSFVLMNNHFHLLITSPELNLSVAMNYFLRESSKEILKSASRLNCTFAPRFFRSQIRTQNEFLKAYKYIYRNPVDANIAHRVEEYPWSTLHQLLGRSRLKIPLAPDNILFENIEQQLDWLNQAPDPTHKALVKKALRKSEFRFPRKIGGYRHKFTDLPF